MRPFRSFLLLLLILCCLTGLWSVIPNIVTLPSPTDFLPFLKPDTVAVSTVKDSSGKDTCMIEQPVKFLKISRDTLSPEAGFPAMIIHRFDSISSSGKPIRIMYYGDSQIEGDRITSYLRKYLRERYGGTGPGLFLPLMPVMYTKSIYVRSSSNWKRYNYLSFKNGEYRGRALGPVMTVCRFLPQGVKPKREKAYIRIVASQMADSSASAFDLLRIFYRNEESPVSIEIKADGRVLLKDTLRVLNGERELRCRLGKPVEVRIDLEGSSSPDICGISIESEKGITVDNIPQRGSAGLEFTMVDSADLHAFYRMLRPDLIVLHYGLNIVRNIRKEYSFYESGLLRQLERIRKVSPGTPVLVVSLSDMAYSHRDSISSFPNIGLIRDAQKKASGQDGSGFWDSRAAMGGESSIVRWSKTKPALAQQDFVHFTNKGADSISGMLARSMFLYSDTSAKGRIMIVPLADTSLLKQTNNADTTGFRAVRQLSIVERIAKYCFTYDPSNPFIFTTTVFWIFLLIVIAGYSLIYRKIRLRNVYLLLVSLYFYFKTGGLFLFMLVFVTMVDYTCGLLIHRAQKKSLRRFFILLSIVSNLGLLAYFKYSGFLTESVNSIFGTHFKVFDILSSISNSWLGTSFDTGSIILPVGISFFTFQSLSYTIDVYRKRMEPVRNIIDFGFYVSFFPHLVAGPIVRASVFMPQVYQEFSLSAREFSHALFMISRGLIKKIIISNFLAVTLVDRVFDAPAMFSGFENLMAVYGYGLQIYCDFSGYTDIAIGVALVLGFRLPINFNSPYKASSITDFWQRWHISLSSWLKDYLYISLGGNRKGRIRTYLNLMITMLLGGLWHGASLRFLLWGGMHGAGLVADKIRKAVFGNGKKFRTIAKIAGIFITFNFVNFCWIFFRAESAESGMTMIRQILNDFSPGSYLGLLPSYGQVFLLMLTGYLVHFLPEKVKESYRGFFIRTPLAGQLAFILLLAVALWQMKFTGVQPFIYFRF